MLCRTQLPIVALLLALKKAVSMLRVACSSAQVYRGCTTLLAGKNKDKRNKNCGEGNSSPRFCRFWAVCA